MEINSPPPTPQFPVFHQNFGRQQFLLLPFPIDSPKSDLWISPVLLPYTATGYIQFYNQSPPPPNSLYFGEKMFQTAISALAVPNQFPPTPISSKTIGDYWEPSSHAGSLENKGNLIYQLFVFIQLFFIHLTFFYLLFVTFIPCRELGEQRIALGLQPKKTLNLHFNTKLRKFKISEYLILILSSCAIKKNPDCSRMYKML